MTIYASKHHVNLYFLFQTGRWAVKDVKPNANGESQEIKIKVRINNNGVVLISSATMVDKKELEAENADPAAETPASNEPMDQEVSVGSMARS